MNYGVVYLVIDGMHTKSPNGYNFTEGGKPCDEVCAKISANNRRQSLRKCAAEKISRMNRAQSSKNFLARAPNIFFSATKIFA